MRTRLLFLAPLAVISCAAVVAVASAIEQNRSHSRSATSWAPEIHGSVGAMKRLGRDDDTPATAIKAAQDFASRQGGTPATVALTLRTLRSDLGEGAGKIYGFSPDGKAVCLMYWEQALTCPSGEISSTPGVLFVLGGGYPAWATKDRVAVPPALVGIASDDVRSVTLIENGIERPAEIRNNAFYLELRDSPPDVKANQLRVDYASGKSASVRVPAQFGG